MTYGPVVPRLPLMRETPLRIVITLIAACMLIAPVALAGWFTLCPQYGNPACPDHTNPLAVALAFRTAGSPALRAFLWLGLIVVYVYPISYLGLAAVSFDRAPWLSLATVLLGWSGSMAWGFISDSMVHINSAAALGLDAWFVREQARFFTSPQILVVATGWVLGHQLAYVVAGIAILRAKALPWWVGALLIVAMPIMGPLAYGTNVGALQVLGYLVVFVASVPAALLLVRRTQAHTAAHA